MQSYKYVNNNSAIQRVVDGGNSRVLYRYTNFRQSADLDTKATRIGPRLDKTGAGFL
jgi:hypothetical protein